ncbi:hypothetical protein PGTUg99_050024 [Puccinia graminis f. sp. tritici]|uniref:HAT C-terminal dimerisation domain-containing protein n=1 Tax=Puccinia graminis f. sp. tritici TaxID=56615 RepID=A0A5B0RHX0_PUCGR|nr:hypothetical protein PGTUg99_050024 [Puccinia graminis f. sp. tritici]
MSKKRSSPATSLQPASQPPQVSHPGRKSWVWKYFVDDPTEEKVKCTVVKEDGKTCTTALTRDKSSSTKSMGEHLFRKHDILDPAKVESGLQDISVLIKKQKNNENFDTKLTINSLKKAIAYLIADADLPFSIVERRSFRDLMLLLNPSVRAGKMLFSRKTIAMEVHYLHKSHTLNLEDVFKNVEHIGFTLDAWTSPNMVAFLGVTAHAITDKWEMVDVVVAMPEVHGAHTGFNFAEIFIEVLDRYEISDKLVSITADNASNNSTLAARVEKVLNGQFYAHEHLLGCMAHVINLAAKDGLEAFGFRPEELEAEITLDQMDSNRMRISHITTPPDGINVDLKTVISRIHGLTMFVRATPQRRDQWKTEIKLVEGHDPTHRKKDRHTDTSQQKNNTRLGSESKDKLLVVDVKTRWNSTYDMLQRALELKDYYDSFCQRSDSKKFALSSAEWEKVDQLMKFLQPLNDATKLLCSSQYPTLNMSLPIYIYLMKQISLVRSTYDASQLLSAAEKMIEKLKKYLKSALEKPAPICAMILDPRIKMLYIEKNASFIQAEVSPTFDPDTALSNFKLEAAHFDRSPARCNPTKSQPTKVECSILADIFGGDQVASDLAAEIRNYLAESNEPQKTEVLDYWRRKQSLYPLLAAMARCYLAIPATSAPSERVFSRSKTVIGPHRGSLNPTSIEHLLCLKDWYRTIGTLDPTPYDIGDLEGDDTP